MEDYLSSKGRDISEDASDIRKVAILCACREEDGNAFPEEEQGAYYSTFRKRRKAVECDRTFAVVLRRFPLVEDYDIMRALIGGSAAALSILLQDCPRGKACLRSSIPTNYGRYVRRELTLTGHSPLYFVETRKSLDEGFLSVETIKIVDLLLERGEYVNDLCGPLATVLHGHIQHCKNNYNKMFVELLIKRGLGINLSGPNGNVLECLWQTANDGQWTEFQKNPRVAICHLIDLGSVNRRPDPNGLVPSMDEMRTAFLWQGRPYNSGYSRGEKRVLENEKRAWRTERRRYYLEGPLREQ